jgi:hypothetical protein
MKQLRVSNELFDDARELQQLLGVEGYVFFRDVKDHDLIQQTKHAVMAWFEARGLIPSSATNPSGPALISVPSDPTRRIC